MESTRRIKSSQTCDSILGMAVDKLPDGAAAGLESPAPPLSDWNLVSATLISSTPAMWHLPPLAGRYAVCDAWKAFEPN